MNPVSSKLWGEWIRLEDDPRGPYSIFTGGRQALEAFPELRRSFELIRWAGVH